MIPTLNVLCAELFPTEIRTTSNGIVFASSCVALVVNYKIYPNAVEMLGFHYVMYFYAIIVAMMVAWGGITIKDTDQLSLTEIQDMHKKTVVARITSRSKEDIKGKEEGFQKGHINVTFSDLS